MDSDPTQELVVRAASALDVPGADAGANIPELRWSRADAALAEAFEQTEATITYVTEQVAPWLETALTPQLVNQLIYEQTRAFANNNQHQTAPQLVQEASVTFYANNFGDNFLQTQLGATFARTLHRYSVAEPSFDEWHMAEPEEREELAEQLRSHIQREMIQAAVYDNPALTQACEESVALLDGDIAATRVELAQLERELEVPGLRFASTWRRYEQSRADMRAHYQEKMNMIARYYKLAGKSDEQIARFIEAGDDTVVGLGEELRGMRLTLGLQKAELAAEQTPQQRRWRTARRLAERGLRALGAKRPVDTMFSYDDVKNMIAQAVVGSPINESERAETHTTRNHGIVRLGIVAAAAATLAVTGLGETKTYNSSSQQATTESTQEATGPHSDSWIGEMLYGLKPDSQPSRAQEATGTNATEWTGVQALQMQDTVNLHFAVDEQGFVYQPEAGDGWIDVLMGSGMSAQEATQAYNANVDWFSAQPESYVMPGGDAGIDSAKVASTGIVMTPAELTNLQ